MRSIHRAVLSTAAVVLIGATAACSGSDDGDEGAFGGALSGDAFAAVRAAAESTTEITSAGFTATTTGPAAAGGDIEMAGVMSWTDGVVLDATVSGGGMRLDPEAPSELRTIMLDDVMYINMGEYFAAEFEGREWMMMDMGALAEESGDPILAQAMDMGLNEANQDPASQMALLLQSPDIESVGEEELDGVTVEHYQGTVTVEDALQNNGYAEILTEEEFQQLTDTMERSGIESYDIDVWVDQNDFPVQIRQEFESAMGPFSTEMRFTDLGAAVDVAAPEEGSSVDFVELMETLAVRPDSL